MHAIPLPRPLQGGVRLVATAALPTRFGAFRVASFCNDVDDGEHIAVVKGDIEGQRDVLVRLHSECLTGDAFGSLRCDCRDQLEAALGLIEKAGRGVVLYLRQEGRGIGIRDKIRAYALQDQGLDTVDANLALGLPSDRRDYAVAAHMLAALGIGSVQLLTNNPDKVRQLRAHGVVVSRRVPHQLPDNPHNRAYLRTKARRSGHELTFDDPSQTEG